MEIDNMVYKQKLLLAVIILGALFCWFLTKKILLINCNSNDCHISGTLVFFEDLKW
jgi:hypothetical protein